MTQWKQSIPKSIIFDVFFVRFGCWIFQSTLANFELPNDEILELLVDWDGLQDIQRLLQCRHAGHVRLHHRLCWFFDSYRDAKNLRRGRWTLFIGWKKQLCNSLRSTSFFERMILKKRHRPPLYLAWMQQINSNVSVCHSRQQLLSTRISLCLQLRHMNPQKH